MIERVVRAERYKTEYAVKRSKESILEVKTAVTSSTYKRAACHCFALNELCDS